MKATIRSWRYLMTPLVFAGMLSISSAAELNPAAVIYKLPDQIPWGPVNAAGAQSAVVVGDPTKPGFYMVYNKWTKGNHFSRPHFHPNDRYIVVLQGTWWVGSGPKFDPANTTPMPAGSFVTHFGKQVHWDGAKDEDAVLLIMGEGPATSTAAGREITPAAPIYSRNHFPRLFTCCFNARPADPRPITAARQSAPAKPSGGAPSTFIATAWCPKRTPWC